MHAVVLDVLAVEATLVPEVLLELLVDVVSHRLPARATQKHISTIGSHIMHRHMSIERYRRVIVSCTQFDMRNVAQNVSPQTINKQTVMNKRNTKRTQNLKIV